MDTSKLDPNTREQLGEIDQNERLNKLETEIKRLDQAVTAATRGSINAQNMAKMALEAANEQNVGVEPSEKKNWLQRLFG